MAGSFRTTLSRPSRFRLVAEGPRGSRVEQTVVVEVVATQPPTIRDHRADAPERRRVVTVRHTAFCKITGRVTGGWRREIAERPGGPTSTWIVDMLLFKAGERRPTAQAPVRGGRYVFDRVPVKGTYFVSPSWTGQPTRVEILTCRAGQSHQIPNIHISGGPMID